MKYSLNNFSTPGVKDSLTLDTVLQRAAAIGMDWQSAEGINDRELSRRLFPSGEGKPAYKMPDYDYIHREMAKPGMTQQLLWFEYCDQCKNAGEIPYQLTQFKTHYRAFLTKTKATMHIQRKPGEIMEVDWAGQPAQLCDDETGELLQAFVFVAALPYSGYAYAREFSIILYYKSHSVVFLLGRRAVSGVCVWRHSPVHTPEEWEIHKRCISPPAHLRKA